MNRINLANYTNVLDSSTLDKSYLIHLLSDCKEIILHKSNLTVQLSNIGKFPDLDQPHWLQVYNFFFDVILVGSILLAGVTGNILSCLVLIRDRSHGTTSLLLTSLAICDTAFLIGCLFFQFFRTLSFFTLWVDYINLYAHTSKLLYSTGMTVRMLRNWTVVLISLERWVAVCKPLHAPSICTRKKARLSVIVLSILCITYNIPHFFIVDAKPLFCIGPNSSLVIENNQTVYLQPEELPTGILIYCSAGMQWVKDNYLFRLLYRLIGYTVVIVFLPTLIIAVFNVLLIRGIKYANARRAQIMARIDCANRQCEPSNYAILRPEHASHPFGHKTASNPENHAYFVRVEKSTRSRTGEVNRLCVGVIVIYLVCELPAVGYQVIHLLQHRAAMDITKPVTNALVCLNSGVNFFVYVFLGRRFRSQLKDLFRRVCCKWHRQSPDADHGHIVHSDMLPSSFGRMSVLSGQTDGGNHHACTTTQHGHHLGTENPNALGRRKVRTRGKRRCGLCVERVKSNRNERTLREYRPVQTSMTDI